MTTAKKDNLVYVFEGERSEVYDIEQNSFSPLKRVDFKVGKSSVVMLD